MGGHAGTLVKGFYKELLNLMSVPKSMLPEVKPSSGDFGETAIQNY